MSYVTKLGAYGLTVAAAFAVALAVLVSVSSTQTAEAADVPLADADTSATAAPGDTVQITVTGEFARVSITETADGVGGSFVAGGGQSVACADDGACDADDADDGSVQVDLKIDADSGGGYILLSVGGLGTATSTKVINVSKATLVGSLDVKAGTKTVTADGGTSTITVTVKNASATPGALARAVVLVTTLGTLTCDGTTAQLCSVTTDATTGEATATLTGAGVEGVATVTGTLGSLTSQDSVTLFGDAKNLSAVPDQGSVEIGGSVYVLLTVTDGAGNPVAGQMVTPVTSKEVEGPADKAVLVVTEKNTPPDGDSPIGRGYSKDKPAAGSAAAIPACGDDNTDTDGDTGGLQELFGPNDGTGDTDEGTNAKGQCVVYVTAPEDTTDATKNATRGVHTLNFAINTIKASATIEVAGKPSSISTDVTGMVEPSSVTKITVSVFDDEDVLVGITDVKVRKVGGDGLIEDAGTSTKNGQSTFTFIAPSAAGSSEILITAGDVNHRLTLQIGEAMEDEPEEPAMPSGDATLTVQGNLGSFSGGSLDDLAAAAGDACPGGSVIWAQGDGGWQVWSSAAPAIANVGFTSAFADGFDGMTLLWVASCEPDGMEDEG